MNIQSSKKYIFTNRTQKQAASVFINLTPSKKS